MLMTMTIAACLLIVEAPAWLGVVDYRQVFSAPGDPYWWNKPGYAIDHELLWTYKPYRHVRTKYTRGVIGGYLCTPPDTDQPEYDLRYDHHGFRNDDDPVAADVVVIGDSYIESPTLPNSLIMTTVLQQLQKATVVNLGASGYGPQQELAVLKRYALPLHPKTIVWVFYEGNDFSDLFNYADAVQHLPQTTRIVHSRWQRSFIKNASEALGRLWTGCRPEPRVKDSYGTVVDSEGQPRRVYFLHPDNDLSSPARELEALSRTINDGGLSIREIDGLKKIKSILAEAYRLCREHDIRFVVAFAPWDYRVYYDLPNFTPTSETIKRWIISDLPQRFAAVVADISPDIDYLDLTPVFKAEVKKGTSVFLSDDPHWTAEGHRIAAEALQKLDVGNPTFLVKQRRDWSNPDFALMVRAHDGSIRYWNKGAEDLYGWQPQEALGKRSHALLKTTFPKPLPSIEAELTKTGRWEGELVHKRRDGSKVRVLSRWELQRNAKDRSAMVIEINSLPNKAKNGNGATQDLALMVRGPDGTIRYWSKGAEQLYGWPPQESIGESSHRLLKTIFPKPLPAIETELMQKGRWEGELVHKRRDGSEVRVASHWELERNGTTPIVVEVNSRRQRDI